MNDLRADQERDSPADGSQKAEGAGAVEYKAYLEGADRQAIEELMVKLEERRAFLLAEMDKVESLEKAIQSLA